jgi:hypothetical protein
LFFLVEVFPEEKEIEVEWARPRATRPYQPNVPPFQQYQTQHQPSAATFHGQHHQPVHQQPFSYLCGNPLLQVPYQKSLQPLGGHHHHRQAEKGNVYSSGHGGYNLGQQVNGQWPAYVGQQSSQLSNVYGYGGGHQQTALAAQLVAEAHATQQGSQHHG